MAHRPRAHDQYSAGQNPADPHPADQHPADPYSTNPYSGTPLTAKEKRLIGRILKPPTVSIPVVEHLNDPDAVITMMRALGVAMLESGQATNDVEDALADMMRAYQLVGARYVVLPTMVIVQHDTAAHTSDLGGVHSSIVRLDQAIAIDDLVRRARRGRAVPRDVIAALERIRSMPPRFGWVLNVVGQGILSLGFGMILNPSWYALPAYACLGILVGLFLVAGQKWTVLAGIVPVAAALVTTVLTVVVFSPSGEVALRLIAPPLVSLLPGLVLTIATIELTSSQIVAGSSRLVYGIAQMFLLAFGVFVGLSITGATATVGISTHQMGMWAPYAGTAVVAVGFVLFNSAPRRLFPWLVVSLLLAYASQMLGTVLLGATMSGFLGAFIVVIFANIIAKFKTAPPAGITMVVAFWLLVPGGLGFVTMNEVTTHAGQTSTALASMGLALGSIALGFLSGHVCTRAAQGAFEVFRQSRSAKS